MKLIINKSLDLIIKYFDNAKSYSSLRLIIEFTLLNNMLKLIFGMFIGIFILIPVGLISGNGFNLFDNLFIEQNFTISMTLFELAIISIIIFPPFETLFFQSFIIWFLSLFTKNITQLIIISAIIFTSFHLELIGIISALPGGILLSWLYLTKKEESKLKAFLITTILHSSFNGAAFLLRIFD